MKTIRKFGGLLSSLLCIGTFGFIFITMLTGASDGMLETYLETEYELKFVLNEEITYDKYLEMIDEENNYVVSEDLFVKAYTVYPEGCPEYVFVIAEEKESAGTVITSSMYYNNFDMEKYLEIVGSDEAVLRHLEYKYKQFFEIKEEITRPLYITDENGNSRQIEYIVLYEATLVGENTPVYVAGIEKTDNGLRYFSSEEYERKY